MAVSVVERVTGTTNSGGVTTNTSAITTVTPTAGDVAVVLVAFPSGVRSVSSVSGLGGTWSHAYGVAGTNRHDVWIGTGITSAGVVTVTLSSAGSCNPEVYVIRGLTSTATSGAYASSSSSGDLTAAAVNAQAGQFVLDAVVTTNTTTGVTNGSATAPTTGWTVNANRLDVGTMGSATRIPSETAATAHQVTSTTAAAITRASTTVVIGSAAPRAVTVGLAASASSARVVTPVAGAATAAGRATVTNSARPITPASGAVSKTVGRATATNIAQPVTPANEHVKFRGSTLVPSGSSGTTKSATIPAATVVGDLMLMVVASRATITTPTGWTLLHDWTLNAGTAPGWHAYAFAKTAASGDPGSTVTMTLASSEVASVAIASYGGSLGVPTDTAKIQYTTDPGTNGYGRFTNSVTATPGSKIIGLFGAVQNPSAGNDTPYLGWPSDGHLRATGTQVFTLVAIADADRDSGTDYSQVNAGAYSARWAGVALTLEPVPVPVTQTIAVGRAGSASTALPVGVYAPTKVTESSNRVGGRLRAGLGVVTWEPPVIAPPTSTAPTLAYDVAKAFGPITRHRSRPTYDVTTAMKVRQRSRILVSGKDVTYFRGVPTPLPSYQLVMPLLYGPATLSFPQIAGSYEALGTGSLKWLRKGARVVIQRVNADTGVVEATDYKGFIIAFNVDGAGLSVEVGGQASGRAALTNKQTPLWHAVRDAGAMAYDAIRTLGLRFEPRLGPDTGIPLAGWGGLSWLDYINELCAKAQDRDGTQWTLLPDNDGAYRFRRKDEETIDATVYLDDAWNVASVRRDIAEEPNRIYMTGVNPEGRRVRGAVYPGLNQGDRPPYPMASHGTTFGQGTTDADTSSGDGVSVMIFRLWAMKYLDREDILGGYDKDAKQAVKSLQEDAGLTATGVMDYPTWRALFDLSATGYSLRGSHIEPMAQRSKVKPWLRTSSGAKLARNPDYDPSVIPVDVNIDVGVGFKANQIREWARAELSTEDNWVGTISLNTGAVIDGTHVPGDPVTEAQVRRARSLKPGMNIWCPQFMGGTRFHISAVSVDADGKVSLTVDTRARDTMKVWEVIARNRETRANPARAWIAQHRSSTMTNDGVGEWDAVGGVIEAVRLTGGQWNVFPVPAGQEGTIRSLRVRTDAPAEYVLAIFGREVTPAWLASKVPAPLTPPTTVTTTDADGNQHKHVRNNNSKAWESERIRHRLDDRFLLYAAGTDEQPCGYFPGKKTNENGDRTDDRLTGRHEDDAGVSYHTFKEPVVYVAIFPDRNTKVVGGRIMWNQLETGS